LAYLFIAAGELRDMFGIVLIIAQPFPTIRGGGHDMCEGRLVDGRGEAMEVRSAFGTASEL
jgi:hypothetical protein